MMAEYMHGGFRPLSSVTVRVASDPLRQASARLADEGSRVDPGDLIAYAIIAGLSSHRAFNRGWEGGPIEREGINLGYFINLSGKAELGAIDSADELSPAELSKGIKELALRQLHGEPLDGSSSTFSITNLHSLGVFNVDSPPLEGHSSTFSVGADHDGPCGSFFNITLTYDLRIADCKMAAQMLADIRATIESGCR